MILTYLDREGYDQQPQGFQKAKQWLQEAQTPQEAIVRVLHVLASRGGGFCSDDEKKVYSINWDWAYTFRRALRQEVKSRTNHYMQQLR